MSPNHLDLDQAIEELRVESPCGDRRERALKAVLNRKGMPLKLPSLAAAAALAIALVLLLAPTRASGIAWVEVVHRTQQATDLHITYFDETGKVIGGQWRSGRLWAHWVKDKSGHVVSEVRSGPTHLYAFVYRPGLTAPNATQYATLWNKTPRMLEGPQKFTGPARTIQDLLKSGSTHLVSQESVKVGGVDVQRFEVESYRHSLTVDADPASGRIQLVRVKGGETLRFEYPASVDPKVFSFEARLTRDVPTIDLRGKGDPKKLPPYMPEPIASKNGIQLREVSISADGDLYVFWTGYLPTKRAASRLRVVGAKTGKTLWLGYYKDGIHPVQGPPERRLVCYRVTLPAKIGDRLTIRIPTASSYAEFKDVPVKKLRPLKE
jgi:hypothetical protein